MLHTENLQNRVKEGLVEIVRQGDEFVLKSQKFCQHSGASLGKDYATVTIESVRRDRTEEETAISTEEQQAKTFRKQLEEMERATEKRRANLKEFDFLEDYLENFDQKSAKSKK